MTGTRLVLALAIAGSLGCRAQEDSFYAATFPCNLTAAQDQCGTTRAGKAMVCYAGSQLGGSDFCAEACDPLNPPGDRRWRCLTSGALVRTCQPHGQATDPSAGCPAGLNCYRTNLLADEGVCLMMPVCTEKSDCKDGMRTECAATIVRGLSPRLAGADKLQCVKPICQSALSDCPPNEVCLATYYELNPVLPDMCVPICIDGLCPPNFGCARTPEAPGAPDVCLPGLPGNRCRADQDCILGDCLDTGAGFNQCTLPVTCESDSACAYLNGLATFVCVEGIPGTGRRCVATTPFYGSSCVDSSECPAGQGCFRYSPYVVDQGHSECRVPCDASLSCPARGGVPHLCLDNGEGGCYPGNLGLPCTESTECLSAFVCRSVSPDPRTRITSPNVCTMACTSDLDCSSHPLIGSFGFCKEGWCRLTGQGGDPCERDSQCVHGVCIPGSGQCAE